MNNTKIPLDPHKTSCPRCGGDAEELIVGHMVKATLSNGQVVYTTNERSAKHKLVKAIRKELGTQHIITWVDLDEGERIPARTICEKCATELIKFAAVVEAGGIYVRCKTCSIEGVAQPHSELAKSVRKFQNCPAPKPMGFEFSSCDQHVEMKAEAEKLEKEIPSDDKTEGSLE